MRFPIDNDDYDGIPEVLTPEAYRALVAAKKKRREVFAARQIALANAKRPHTSPTRTFRSWFFTPQSTR